MYIIIYLTEWFILLCGFLSMNIIINVRFYYCDFLGKAITILKGHESMLYEALSVIVGPFFIFAIVKM